MTKDTSNPTFDLAVQFVNFTNRHLFLTGKAGTGKTTFLRHIKETCNKKMAVVAPTGVAAINAGGVTIHSFFQLPIGSFIPSHESPPGNGNFYNKKGLFQHFRYSTSKRELLQELELLVIDEISMVRADLLDAIDLVLKTIRKKPFLPFGGVQVLYIGDLFQLPPVVNDQEWEVLRQYYKGAFFFNAQAIQQFPPLYLELSKIYRQSDADFIRLLNNVRDDKLQQEDIDLLNRHYNPGFKPEKPGEYITLTSHNSKADIINQSELKKLPGQLYSFKAEIEGEFNERSVPAEEVLQIKEGAQVMFIRNDKGEERRYYNGKIATVKRVTGNEIRVIFPDSSEEMQLEKETWRNVRYRYDQNADEIEEEVLGTFTQYPIRLAWAITIHKSQGLTFEKAIIDAGASFAPGQVYVALSRLTSLNGLVLYSKISQDCISTDEQALDFSDNNKSQDHLPLELKEAQKQYIFNKLLETFDFGKLTEHLETFASGIEQRQIPLKEKSIQLLNGLLEKMRLQHKTAEKFVMQIREIIGNTAKKDTNFLNSRVEAASKYFREFLFEQLFKPLQEHYDDMQKRSKTRKYIKEIQLLTARLKHKKQHLEQAAAITAGIAKGENMNKLLQSIHQMKKEAAAEIVTEAKEEKRKSKTGKPAKGETQRISLAMFKEGKNIEEIAEVRSMVTSTIESHLTHFIATGEIEVSDLVHPDKLAIITKLMEDLGDVPSSEIKARLGDEYTYGEIRAVREYLKVNVS